MNFYDRLFIKENEIDFCLVRRRIDKNNYVWFKFSGKCLKKNLYRLQNKKGHYHTNIYYCYTIMDFPIDKTLIIVLKDGSRIEFSDYIGYGGFYEGCIYIKAPKFMPEKFNLVNKFRVLEACYIKKDDDIDKLIKEEPIEEELEEPSHKVGIFTRIVNFIRGNK